MSSVLNADELMHFGVKGMKWGVRRKSKHSSDYTESRAMKRRGVKNLSTAELKKLNSRMQAEQQYKQLNPSLFNRGTKALGTAAAVLGSVGAVSAGIKKYGPAGKKAGLAILGVIGSTVLKNH